MLHEKYLMFLDHVVDAKKDKDYEIAQNFFL